VAEGDGQVPAGTNEQVRRWKEWYQRQQAGSAGKRTVVSDRFGR
jgi:hypothetical protein